MSGRPGDWICGSCGNLNFSHRTECNRCGAPKGPDSKPAEQSFAGQPHMGQRGGGGGGRGGGGGGGSLMSAMQNQDNSCWELLKKGHCPREPCKWFPCTLGIKNRVQMAALQRFAMSGKNPHDATCWNLQQKHRCNSEGCKWWPCSTGAITKGAVEKMKVPYLECLACYELSKNGECKKGERCEWWPCTSGIFTKAELDMRMTEANADSGGGYMGGGGGRRGFSAGGGGGYQQQEAAPAQPDFSSGGGGGTELHSW